MADKVDCSKDAEIHGALQMITPEEAGCSPLALRIAKNILKQPAFSTVRVAMNDHDNLAVFCGFLAREIIEKELHTFSPQLFPKTHREISPPERGKIDGTLAKINSWRI